MDNSFGSRPPWPGRPARLQGQPFPNMQPAMNMQFRPDQSIQMRGPVMNGYGGTMPVSTPSSLGGGYPMWDMDIPSQMFMQAVNFERLMQQQVKTDSSADLSVASNKPVSDTSYQSDTGRDLIEQQQAVEQARLLQRFKELRQWQQQQQEMLMSQQQQQLSLLRKEQERMHGMISKQRDNQWGGGHPNFYGNTETPPRRELPPGMDMSKILSQPEQQDNGSQHTLPKPVMYVQPKDDDDEIKTNPDLFSDTNSNRGSQAGVEDGMFPIPDSASEASVEVGIHQMRQGEVKSLSQLRHRYNPHELDAPKKLHRSFAELEHDAEFLNLSSQSPTMLEMQHGKISETRADKIEEKGESEGDDDDDSDDSDTDDDDDDSDEDDDESSDNQEDTQIEVKASHNIDELPIKPGTEGGKTFEQLLEEQLKAEEERLKEANANQDSPSQPKRTFLKKGEGIARFESKPGQRPPKNKKKVTASQGSTQASHRQPTQKSAVDPGQNKHVSKAPGKPPAHSKAGNQPAKKSGVQSSKHQKSEDKGKKSASKSPVRDTGKQTKLTEASANETKPTKINIKRADSYPDDASFVANLKERQKESERDLEELDEFEILEQFADNMSFCSNSSIVTKGLRGLQNDRILTGVVPKVQEVGRPTSPRAALIKKLELEKQMKHKQQLEQQSNIKHGSVHKETKSGDVCTKTGENLLKTDNRHKSVSQAPSGTGQVVNGSNKEVKKDSKSDDDDDEYESLSDSSDDSSSDEDDDKVVKDARIDSHAQLKHGILSHLGRTSLHEESHTKGKNDSVCSTDRKLERVLSYTGFTESSSVSQTSESEQEIESDDDEFDFSGGYSAMEKKEPIKPLTRKVAGRDDKNKFPFQNLPSDSDLMQTSLNVSAFAPKAKSPIVISKEKISKPESQGSLIRNIYTEETKFSYHSDSDSVGNKQNDSLSEDDDNRSNDGEKKSRKAFGEKKTLQFDDDEEWGDLTPKVLKSRRRKESESEHDKTLVEDSETASSKPEVVEKESEDTPPTSKLVSKLFPSLKPAQKKQEEQNLEKIQSVSQTNTGDGVQSKVLRDKLMELEREIEKFRNENKHLATLRTEREQGLTVLKKEIAEFEKEKSLELKRIEEFRNEEMKKLKHEKKMFEKYQKAARAGPDKKEREEIENLKSQLADLQEELKRKESRWSANNSRLRDKIDQLEQQNEELREEIKLLEKKRLEWMQKDQKNKSRPGGPQTLLRSSTPTEELEQMTNGHVEQGYNDLSASTTMRSNSSLKPSQQQPKVNIRTSFPPPSKQTAHSNTQSAQNKPLNVNQSAKPVNHSTSAKMNQSKKPVTHNAKQGHSGHSQTHASNRSGQKVTGKANSSVISGKSSNSSDSKNMLRNSLAEDLPRRELGTIAEPQDLSMYSETNGDIVPALQNMPRKFAPRPGVDKSVIDKGDNDEYDEIQHSDGKVERTYKNGAREILFSNGTRKEISSDGKSIVVSFFNGDIKQIMADQRVIYYYAENQTTHTNYPDGLEIIQFPNQQTEKLYPDGTKEITFPDQTIKYIFPNGSEESIFADGTVIRLEKNGDKTMEFPNGQREIHTQEYKKREYPDGTVKTVYPDGRQETRYSNGRLRVKDKDGNVIVDRQC